MELNEKMLIETCSRVEVLEERFDRHLDKIDEKLDGLSSMELRIMQAINAVEMRGVKAENEINLKVYGIFSAIMAGVYGVGEGIKHLFK